MKKLIVGPVLGVEKESRYTICLMTSSDVEAVKVHIEGTAVEASEEAVLPSGVFWRTECSLDLQTAGRSVSYEIIVDGEQAIDKHERESWQFYMPGKDEKPKVAYASCNGFSDAGLKSKTNSPYHLWLKMSEEHSDEPFSLLLMGGDQVYADSIWSEVRSLATWSELDREEKIKRKATKEMKRDIDRFYEKLYRERWADKHMSLMLASVPSLMMWDDHDIFDGWGSYPEDMQQCDVYQCIYDNARKYFELFQIRSTKNANLLNEPSEESVFYAQAIQFRQYQILAIDNRAERTLERVMSEQQWAAINHYLTSINDKPQDLLLMTAVPVVYRDFSFTEGVMDATPWEEELTDDLKDHWRAKEHQGERARLIMRLLDNAKSRQARTVMLSGDVHLGCLGLVADRRGEQVTKIHQVVSSGIVHPSPSRIQWYGIMAVTNDRDEYLNEDKTIEISMIQPHSSDKYIRTRNYVSLFEGTDNKLWVNWMCEGKDKPVYPLEPNN